MGNTTQSFTSALTLKSLEQIILKFNMSLRKALLVAATQSRNISTCNGSGFLVQEYLIHSPNALNNSSQKMIPPEENSGFVLNKNTGIREIKVYKSKEIKPEQDMSPYGFLLNQNFQFKK